MKSSVGEEDKYSFYGGKEDTVQTEGEKCERNIRDLFTQLYLPLFIS